MNSNFYLNQKTKIELISFYLEKIEVEKSMMLLVGNLIAYDQINILFESPRLDKQCYCHVDYVITNLTQLEWVRVRKEILWLK
jgi:hypothetical protein